MSESLPHTYDELLVEQELVEHRRGIGQPLVCLTFDDGPSPWTEQVVAHLTAHNAGATFFTVGASIEQPGGRNMIRSLIAKGFEIGNHTFNHPHLPVLSDIEILHEIRRTSEVVKEATGTVPIYWRAPYCDGDEQTRKIIATLSLREVEFSVGAEDYAATADEIVERVLRDIQAGDIVALHDGRAITDGPDDSSPTREETVAALPRILEGLAERGLRSVTVSELLAAAASA